MILTGFAQRLLQSPFSALAPVKPCGNAMSQQMRFRYQYLRNRTRVKRDVARRPAVAEFELKRMVYKALHRDQRLPMQDRLRAMLGLHSMHSYTIANAVKARCVFGARGTGVLPGFRVSRIVFRESGINGRLPGAMRAQW